MALAMTLHTCSVCSLAWFGTYCLHECIKTQRCYGVCQLWLEALAHVHEPFVHTPCKDFLFA